VRLLASLRTERFVHPRTHAHHVWLAVCTPIRHRSAIGTDMVSKNLLTSTEALTLIEEVSGTAIKPDTFRSYSTRGQAPTPKEKVGRTLLWDKAEIEQWARNRPGRGARTDLTRNRSGRSNTRT
jgi:predicted DNA-binding transcriptional regulator AlpA